MLGIPDEDLNGRKRKGSQVTFKEEEDVINPEDVDPSIGKFRNLIQTAIIPNKRFRIDKTQNSGNEVARSSFHILRPVGSDNHSLYNRMSPLFSSSLSSKLGIHLPNPAPDIDLNKPNESIGTSISPSAFTGNALQLSLNEPRKKKYAKEAWPGKKTGSLLM